MNVPVPESPSTRLRRNLTTAFDRPTLLMGLAALGWAFLWMALESLFQRREVGAWIQALAPLGVCLIGAAGLILAAPARGGRLFTSPRLAGVLGFVLLVGLGGGWAVIRARSGSVLPGGWLDWPLSLLATVRLGDLLRSLWLEALLLPLAAMSLTVLWTRRASPGWRGRNAGLLLALAGPLLLAAGSLWNRAASARAFQSMEPGASAGVFEGVRAADGLQTLPGFRVRLERFEATPQKPGFRLGVQPPAGGAGLPWSIPVEPGQAGTLPGGLRYQVERLIPNALPSGRVVEDPQSSGNPAVQILLGLGNTEPLMGVLFARDPESWRREEPEGRFAVVYRERFDSSLLQLLRPHPPLNQKLVLTFMGKTLEHPDRLGETWNLPGFSLTVTGIYPDLGGLRTDQAGHQELFTRSPLYLNPWIQLQLRQASGAQAPLLLSARPVEDKTYTSYLARTLPPGMDLRYVPEGAEVQRRFVLITTADSKVRLVEDGRVVRTEDLVLNHPFLVAKGLSVTVLARYDRARFEPDFVPDPDVDATAGSEHPALRLRVWDPANGTAESRWLQGRGEDGQPVGAAFLGGRIRLVYGPKPPDLRDLRGTLAITDPSGDVLARGTVTSGDPLVFRGHRFYLDGWVPGPPAAGRLLMVTDPGLWLGWAGLACLAAGLGWLLLTGRPEDRDV